MPTKPSVIHGPLPWWAKLYDTGGLSIKTKTGMPGMKADMVVLLPSSPAFAHETGHTPSSDCDLCLAENAVGPDATRPDDILTMYSGKTVEVNNTDAEGRLVLADGVAYAQQHFQPDYIIDGGDIDGCSAGGDGSTTRSGGF